MVSIAADGRSGRSSDQLDRHVAARGEGGRARCRGHGRAPAGGCRGPGRAARRWPPWRCGGRRRPAPGPAPGRPARSRRVAPPSFSLARPSFMATATICACAPSCRSRSIRRSRAAESSTKSGPGLLQLTHPLDAVLLQAVDGPEDQRRARQRQRRQRGQRPQPAGGGEQQDAEDDIEDAAGHTHTHPQPGTAVFPRPDQESHQDRLRGRRVVRRCVHRAASCPTAHAARCVKASSGRWPAGGRRSRRSAPPRPAAAPPAR